jgi:integrase
VTGEPLIPGPLYGLRTWRVMDGERLAGPHLRTAWPEGGEWLRAGCEQPHDAPAPGCDCGVHAWHPRLSSAKALLAGRFEVPGAVEAEGAVEIHEDGFRAERARPRAIFLAPGRNSHQLRRIAERYRAELVEVRGPADVLAWCADRGLDEPVVAALLGPEEAEQRRRIRRRKARLDALRIVAALVVAAVLVLLGLEFIADPPGDRVLQGRTGEVRRP